MIQIRYVLFIFLLQNLIISWIYDFWKCWILERLPMSAEMLIGKYVSCSLQGALVWRRTRPQPWRKWAATSSASSAKRSIFGTPLFRPWLSLTLFSGDFLTKQCHRGGLLPKGQQACLLLQLSEFKSHWLHKFSVRKNENKRKTGGVWPILKKSIKK